MARLFTARLASASMEFARLYHEVHEEYSKYLQPIVKGRDLRFSRIIPVQKAVESAQGVIPLVTDLYEEIVDRNHSFCLMATGWQVS